MPDTVTLHGDDWEWEKLEDHVEWAVGEDWRFTKWRDRPEGADGSDQLRGHDHCIICYWTIWETDEPASGTAYTNGGNWLCVECYEKLVAPGLEAES